MAIAAIQISFSGIGRPLARNCVFDVPILLGGGRVAWQHRTARDKFINACKILCDTRGLTRPIIEFAKDNTGHKHFAGLCQALLYRILSREERNHDIRIEQKSTSPRHGLAHTRLQSLGP